MFKSSALFIALLIFQVALAEKVKVEVYYEALCPDSKEFITTQLFPLYSDPEFKDRLNVNLVPFGKASWKEVNGQTSFTCQHGPDECKSNMFLSCSLKMNTPDQALKYTNCIMSEAMPVQHLKTCAEKLSLNYEELKTCQEDANEGPMYLKENGNKTYSLKPKLVFVPTVVINDKLDRKEIPKILSNFKEVICSKIKDDKPKSC